MRSRRPPSPKPPFVYVCSRRLIFWLARAEDADRPRPQKAMMKKAGRKRAAASDSPDGDSIRPDAVAVCKDGEVKVHSFFLRVTSPVFEAMFTSEMSEQKSKRFKVDIESRAKFIEFYGFLRPLGLSGRKKINDRNVDYILEMSEYYQVQALKDECAIALARLPVTVDRLLQAQKYQLQKQYQRCLIHIAKRIDESQWDISALQAHPHLLMELMLRVQKSYRAVRRNRKEIVEMITGGMTPLIPEGQLPELEFEDSDVEEIESEDEGEESEEEF